MYGSYPWWTSVWWISLLLVVFLLLFHVTLVWYRNLTRVAWKRVDYIWVSLGFLGVLGTVDQSRALYTNSYLELGLVDQGWQGCFAAAGIPVP